MTDLDDLIDRYIAVWNEPDAARRRRDIEALWAPEGATCHRLLDARGYDAIEARVGGAQEKWVRLAGNRFRSRRNAAGHHDMVRFNWDMAPAVGGEAISIGLNFLLLAPDGRIRSDYQFAVPGSPATLEVERLVARYVALWNETDGPRRRARIAELWAEDGAHVNHATIRHGRGAIEAEAIEVHDACIAKGFVFRSVDADGHHDVVRFGWEMVPASGGAVAASGSSLLLLAPDGRLRADYLFDDPPAT